MDKLHKEKSLRWKLSIPVFLAMRRAPNYCTQSPPVELASSPLQHGPQTRNLELAKLLLQFGLLGVSGSGLCLSFFYHGR